MCYHSFRARTAVLAWCGLTIAAAVGCSSDAKQAGGARRASGGPAAPVAPIITAQSAAYRVDALASPGTLVGTVVADGALPADSVIDVPAEQQAVCGATVSDPSLQHAGGALGNVIVWISDARRGKALPVDRRFELTTQRCAFDPHVQAVVVGSTVNVHNDDDAPELTRMIRLDSGDTLAAISLIDDGGVVPNDRIARAPGIVRLRSAVHPWADGYVAVFDQPYFAVTQPNGGFRIDSLPPGRYTLMAWQERMRRPVAQAVDVAAGKETKITVRLPLTAR